MGFYLKTALTWAVTSLPAGQGCQASPRACPGEVF